LIVKEVVNENGRVFHLRLGERRACRAVVMHPHTRDTWYPAGTEVEIVGPGKDRAAGSVGQRVAARFPGGEIIHIGPANLLTVEEEYSS
jgi:hypothetical protein